MLIREHRSKTAEAVKGSDYIRYTLSALSFWKKQSSNL